MIHFTPTEKRILQVLGDGLPHTKEELHTCLMDELSEVDTVKTHISNLRTKLQLRGQDIDCIKHNRRYKYRQVRLLKNPNLE